MFRSLLDYVFSRAKWRKIQLLCKERAIALAFAVARRRDAGAYGVSPDAVGKNADQSRSPPAHAHGFRDDYAAVQALEAAGNLPAPQEISWRYESDVPVSRDVLTNSAVQYAQDRHLASGRLQTSFDYRLANIPMASVCSNGATHVSIFDARDSCLKEYSYVKFRRDGQRVAFARRHLPTTRFYPGLTLNLFGNVENAAGNYGHWMIDGIGLLFLALRQYSLDQFKHFLVPELRYDFQRESLLALGIPKSGILEIPSLCCYRFEHLVCASAPRGVSSGNTPGWLIDGYRRLLLPASPSPRRKRLYISRRDAGSRKFVNEEQSIELLSGYGFESVELSVHDFSEKVALFAHAEFIIGLTGAGLTNLMFCQADTKVIELFPTSYVTYFFASMAAHLALDYHALIFENASVLSSVNKYYGNLSLDIDLLHTHVKQLLGEKCSL